MMASSGRGINAESPSGAAERGGLDGQEGMAWTHLRLSRNGLLSPSKHSICGMTSLRYSAPLGVSAFSFCRFAFRQAIEPA